MYENHFICHLIPSSDRSRNHVQHKNDLQRTARVRELFSRKEKKKKESYFQQKTTRSPAIAGTASIESQHHRVSLGMREELEVVQTAQSHRRIMESFPRCLEKLEKELVLFKKAKKAFIFSAKAIYNISTIIWITESDICEKEPQESKFYRAICLCA